MLSANDTLLLLYMAGIKKASVTPCAVGLERVMGIEPTSKAWEAFVLPLNYTRSEPRPDGSLYNRTEPLVSLNPEPSGSQAIRCDGSWF